MHLDDLFKFEGQFNKKDRMFTLSLNVPEAAAIWSCFDEKTVSNVTEKLDKALLKDFDSLFESGYFIFLIGLPDGDLGEEIVETIYAYKKGRKPPKSLGTWKYSRKDRLAVLVWNVPEWFQGTIPDWFKGTNGRFYVSDFDEIVGICKDWFVNSP